jgi:hypothetical protein
MFVFSVLPFMSCLKPPCQPMTFISRLDSIKYGVYRVVISYDDPCGDTMSLHVIDREGCFDTCFSVTRSGVYTSRRFECCGPPRIVTEISSGAVCK